MKTANNFVNLLINILMTVFLINKQIALAQGRQFTFSMALKRCIICTITYTIPAIYEFSGP
jgi:hypothetical protein